MLMRPSPIRRLVFLLLVVLSRGLSAQSETQSPTGRIVGRVDTRIILLSGFGISAIALWQMSGYTLVLSDCGGNAAARQAAPCARP